MNEETLLSVRSLKTYLYLASGVLKAVDGVSFSLGRGKTLGIVGESGSGKSLTASSVIRLLPKDIGKIVDGEIRFDGRNMRELSEKELREVRGKDISVIFQDPMTALDPVFKVGDQMMELIRSHTHMGREEARDLIIRTLGMVGIPDPASRMDSYPYELSGGMCQRVMIAMAVCCQPKLIIADEPTTALDVTVQSQVLKLLKNLQRQMGTSILLITHNMGIVWKMCDTVMVMYAGRTVEYTGMKELYSKPLHPYTWGLLDSIPKLSDEAKTELKTIEGTPPDLRVAGDRCHFCDRCPYALPECARKMPPLLEIEPGHFVACLRQGGGRTLKRGETATNG